MLIYANRGHEWATQASLELTEKLTTVHINVAALTLLTFTDVITSLAARVTEFQMISAYSF